MRNLIYLALTLTTANSYAGGRDVGNGGGAFVCMTASERITYAESQDLWEAQNDLGLKLLAMANQEDEISLAIGALERIKLVNPKFYEKAEGAFYDILKRRRILPVKILETGDSLHQFEKFGCADSNSFARFQQAAVYTNENKITYAKQIWDQMSALDRAALTVHETVYKVLRDNYNDTDSRRARFIVGHLFSDVDEPSLKKAIPSLHFDPNGTNLSYDAKVAELERRFAQGTVPSARAQEKLFSRTKRNDGWIIYVFYPKLPSIPRSVEREIGWAMPDKTLIGRDPGIGFSSCSYPYSRRTSGGTGKYMVYSLHDEKSYLGSRFGSGFYGEGWYNEMREDESGDIILREFDPTCVDGSGLFEACKKYDVKAVRLRFIQMDD